MNNYFQMDFTLQQVNAISSLGLAHMGDGVYELLCRAHLCAGGDQTVLKLHRDTVEMVKATAQAKFADKIMNLIICIKSFFIGIASFLRGRSLLDFFIFTDGRENISTLTNRC